ncbi:hypothetical protein E3P92_01676 [Wallemia ichthyophaga]|nr:hypothetical protein E3P91_01516 [Wallemia ichthyophaga]TIA81454.1 hypothetical protein E3P98_02046 [Wallemia ichthyophaga]TIA96234.1 hypothetical protein E3P95_03353 [Wallemia ichthyophaga]TIA99228.1 hypothetical protein E3P94_02669 [Wallemia ichthyophaga]TIB15488.1 hypothetical protein E3P92_01676 [Wallemia ichthyophaga]
MSSLSMVRICRTVKSHIVFTLCNSSRKTKKTLQRKLHGYAAAITGNHKANKERAQTEREQIDDLSMELELADEDQPVLYKLGDSFVYISLEKAQSQIEADCNALDAIIDGLKSRAEDCERSMSELKVHLKSKFKDSINLDR